MPHALLNSLSKFSPNPKPSRVQPGTVHGSYTMPLSPRPGQPKFAVHLAAGALTVNGTSIPNARFTQNGVSWSSQTGAGFSSGSLHTMAGGAMLSGVITAGATALSATATPVNLLVDQLEFSSEVCRNPGASPQTWEAGPPLEIGIGSEGDGSDPSQQLLQIQLKVAGVPIENAAPVPPATGDAPGTTIVFSIADFEYDSDFTNPAFPIPSSASIVLDQLGDSFSGTMTAFQSPDGATWAWRGTALPAVQPTLATSAAAPQLTNAAVIEQHTESSAPLSLPDLLSLTTDGAVDVAKDKFHDFMFYAMGDWRNKLFGTPQPALSATEQQIIADNNSFYTQSACDAYILKQLSGLSKDQGGPSTPISDADIDKLNYFWTRDITMTPGYNDISNRLTQLAWLNVTPRIGDYLADTSTNWAQALYTAVSTTHALDSAFVAFQAAGYQLTQVNRIAEMLVALSPRRDQSFGNSANPVPCTYADLYHMAFMNRFCIQLSQQVSYSTPENVQDFAAFLASWMQSVRQFSSTGGSDQQNKMSPGATSVMADLNAVINAAEQEQNGLNNLTTEIASGLATQAGASLFGKLANWTKLNPMGQKISSGALRAIAVAGFCYGLTNSINAFKNWKSLTDAQKAQNVINASKLSIDLMNIVADVTPSNLFTGFFNVSMEWDGLGEAIGEALAQDLGPDENFFSESVRTVAPEMEAAETDSAFAKIFQSGSKFMKGFAVITAAAATAFSAYQVYEDFDGDTTTAKEVVDVLILTANVIQLVGTVALFIAADCAIATLGPVGAVLGVVLAIVSAFLPSPPPDRPSDDYMNDTGNSHLEAMTTPPPGWNTPATAH